MQLVESSNAYYNAVSGIMEQVLDDFVTVTGRVYKPFEYSYHGTTEPRVAVVTMGSSVKVVDGTLKYLKSEQTCLIGVRMFRPWSSKLFAESLPRSVKRIAVLDRTREGGSQGEPLYLDVCTSLMTECRFDVFVAGGRYGLGSKDFTPRMVEAVIRNVSRKDTTDIQRPFTVGINDDVTHLSLSLGRPLKTLSEKEVTQCVFWGFGSDGKHRRHSKDFQLRSYCATVLTFIVSCFLTGTVGANKEAIKMIGNFHQDMSVQAYFEYDAKKSSGWTMSHLRFSSTQVIDAPFRVEDGEAAYVACHNESYVQAGKFDVVKYLKRRGTFFLNTTIASIEDPQKRIEALEALVSPTILRKLAHRNSKFYIMDAGSLATKFGLAGRINMICMCTFFRLSNIIPLDEAVALLKAAIVKNYSSKGEEVVRNNILLLDTVVSDPNTMILVEIPQSWRSIVESSSYQNRHIALIDDDKVKKFMNEIAEPVTRLEGEDIPVSAFLRNNLLGGTMITGTSKFEKRRPNPSGQVRMISLQ